MESARAKKAKETTATEEDQETRGRPISLAPLTFEEAVSGLLQVRLEPEELRPPKGSAQRIGLNRVS
jgi:hypothetical protein